MNECIVGWAHTPFGKLEGEDIESLIARVTRDAIADAGLQPEDIDDIYLSHFGGGFIRERFLSSLPHQVADGLRFTPATRVENACASGAAAIRMGLNSIAAKRARFVLVVGAEKMTHVPTDQVGDILLSASYLREESGAPAGFVGLFSQIAALYFERYGDQSDALAHIAARNHHNGMVNPLAHFRKDLSYEFCREASDKNPVVAAPLKRTDCSAISDGAAAVILTDRDTARGMNKAVEFLAAEQVNDFKPMKRRDLTSLESCAEAWRQAFRTSGTTINDLSFVETHDCFTIAELLEYEAMGLTPVGKGAVAIYEGWMQKDGKLPVNPSGGLKAKGHPIGATGVSMHVMASMQLLGQAGDMQIPNAELAGVFNMGGAAVASYASILSQLR